MEDQQFRSRRSYVYDSKAGRSKKKIIAVFGGLLIVAIVVVVGAMALLGASIEEEDEDIFASPATVQTSVESEEATNEIEDEIEEDEEVLEEEPELDRSDFSILIQNGSGTAGAAGRLADRLRDLGYSIGGTQNADRFDYEETVIRVSSGNNALLNLLKADLEGEYSIGETSTEYSGNGDAVVIIGAE